MSTFTIFLILIMIVAFLLVIVIMVQNPKGGGLSSSFGGGGGGQIGGVQQTGDFLDKSTWTLATIMIVLILVSNIFIMGGSSLQSKTFDENADPAIPATENTFPTGTGDTTDTPE